MNSAFSASLGVSVVAGPGDRAAPADVRAAQLRGAVLGAHDPPRAAGHVGAPLDAGHQRRPHGRRRASRLHALPPHLLRQGVGKHQRRRRAWVYLPTGGFPS